MIPRYTRPEMGRIWSDESRFRTWLKVELAATETLAEAGIVPREAAKAIREKVRKWVQDDEVGGLVLSIGLPLSYAAKINELQMRAKVLRNSDLPNR